MARRIGAREVLRLRSVNGLSRNAIARTAHVTKHGVQNVLLELMELRCGTASTVFCTQFKKKDWHPRLGGGVHADAIMDRIVHNAVWVDMGEANMRQRRGADRWQ